MEVQAIAQGSCTECGASEENWSVVNRQMFDNSNEEEGTNGVERTLSCECGIGAVVTITPDGLMTEGPISHEEASWNEGEEESDEE